MSFAASLEQPARAVPRAAAIRVGIVDTGIGNFGSIAGAMRRAGASSFLAADAAAISNASHIVLPGVGSFDAAIGVIDRRGLRPVLTRRVVDEGIPVLGICLGMQMLGASSEEGQLAGLGWLRGRAVRFRPPPGAAPLRVPHIGWNGTVTRRPSPLLDGIVGGGRFYYVHSYHYAEAAEEDVVATTDYGYPFAAVVRHQNIVGMQFHPERSGPDGLRVIENFLALKQGAR
jgi:imidazole glycerol-phosphate synthase subunit HisH